MKKNIKLRKKPTLKDVTKYDVRLLIKAYNLKEDEFLCFGSAYGKLAELMLVTEDNRISYYGRKLVQHLNFEA
jgi:hypothetical protein